MTPCYICGSPIEKLALDSRDMKIRPCGTCEQVIQDTANTMDPDYEFEVFEDEGFPIDNEN